MKLFEEFKLYETMWEAPLMEAKADTQKLIDFAGQDLATRFLNIKNRLKAPENDLYYWIKNKSKEELETAVNKLETTLSNTSAKKDIIAQGAKLVASTPHWNIYHITSIEAAQKLGRDTKWCITGVYGDIEFYWNKYKSEGADFYFLITKDKYDPRGLISKIAVSIYDSPEYVAYDTNNKKLIYNKKYTAFNQQNQDMFMDEIPYIDEIKLPGITNPLKFMQGFTDQQENNNINNQNLEWDADDWN